MRITRVPTIVVALLATLLAPAPAGAAEVTLPSTLAWTAYDVGSAGYNQAVAIGNALKNRFNVSLRVLPGKNDVSRQVPLRERKVQFSAAGLACYYSQEAVFEFAAHEWGPQPVRLLLTANAETNLSIGVAADAGVKTLADLKGKRVAWVVAAPALNENIAALLHFAGLGWNDVVKVEFPGFGASWDGIIAGQVDAAFASTTSGKAYQLEASRRGLHWPAVPHADRAGWARLAKVAPYFVPNVGTEGAGLSPSRPHEGAAYPYPILITYADQEPDLVYSMSRAMVELFPAYKDAAPGANGWALERQKFTWVVPYHEGAIRYFKEARVWTPDMQAHNDRLLERQRVLKQAWDAFVREKVDAAAFQPAWMKARAATLEKAGFDPVWR